MNRIHHDPHKVGCIVREFDILLEPCTTTSPRRVMTANEQSHDTDEKREGQVTVDVKSAAVDDRADAESLDALHGDEALKLVGTWRRAEFSDEYNRRLRRKLVSRTPLGINRD